MSNIRHPEPVDPTNGMISCDESNASEVQATADCDCCGLYFASGVEYGEYMRSAKNICDECELFSTAMYWNSIT